MINKHHVYQEAPKVKRLRVNSQFAHVPFHTHAFEHKESAILQLQCLRCAFSSAFRPPVQLYAVCDVPESDHVLHQQLRNITPPHFEAVPNMTQ